MNLSTRLRRLIEERGIKQNQVAKELHIANSTFNGYITRGSQPDNITLIRMADYFGVSVDYLVGATEMRVYEENPMSDEEEELLGIYRSLKADSQELLMEQAHLYLGREIKKKKEKKNQ